ncbi:MAG: SDR family NAD(P)-dependent oxidoreductase [Candidatus Aenigmarchaeota archaeon]|nr:SDR family NAD(P)-dependent oxidoreductase [Candidatus Aenigmarchaeota archaeon]
MGQRVLITGGLGFIGSNLAHELVRRGDRVTILDAMLEPMGFNLANLDGIRDRVTLITGDVRDREAVEKAVKDQDVIYACAGQVSHLDSMTDPWTDIDINIRGNLTVLEACRKLNDRARIIYAGTRGQIGKLVRRPCDETHPDNPTDIYGADKWAAEKYHLIYHTTYGMKTCSLRINNTYGPRHQMKHGKYGILNYFIRLCFFGQPIKVFTPGDQLRDYNYISDVVRAMLLADSDKADGEIFLLGSGEPVSLLEIAKKIVAAAKQRNLEARYELVPWPGERKTIEVGDFYVSFDKFAKTFSWKPQVGIDEGLRLTFDFYTAHRDKYIV